MRTGWAMGCVVCWMLAGLAGAAESSTPAQPAPSLRLIEPESVDRKAAPVKMGDVLRIRVTGHNLTYQNGKATGVRLVLDDVVMNSLGDPTALREGDATVLLFRLERDSEDANSLADWKRLLQRQSGSVKTPAMALAIGGAAPQPVASVQGLRFTVVPQQQMCVTLMVGLALFVLLFLWLVKNDSALRDYKYGPYSLGKSQMAFWGLLVALTFLAIWLNTGQMEHIPPQVLILIGISGATGLGALVIGDSKKAAEIAELEVKQQKVLTDAELARLNELRQPTPGNAGFFRDICDGGQGIMSFHRLQTVIWTLILGLVFVFDVLRVIAMPQFTDTLLLLMGISNSIYLGFKFPEKSQDSPASSGKR